MLRKRVLAQASQAIGKRPQRYKKTNNSKHIHNTVIGILLLGIYENRV